MKKLLVVLVGAGLVALPSTAVPKTHPTPKAGTYAGHTTQTDSRGRHAAVHFSFYRRTLHDLTIQFREACSSGHTLYAQLGHLRVGPVSGLGLIGHPPSTRGPITLFDNSAGTEYSTYFLAVVLVGANKITGQFQAHTRLFNAAGMKVDDCRMRIASWSATRRRR